VSALLEVRGVDVRYGDFQALFGIDLTVAEGETVSIIGANGGGKSTLLKSIAGLVPPSSGTISFAGADITTVAAHRRVSEGIALVPEGRRIFPSLNVTENLLVGAHSRRSGPWSLRSVLDAFPLLDRLKDRDTHGLSGGERQTLAIGRALMSNPRLLLLDEVSLGLAPIVVKQVYEAVPRITSQGTTVLVVEQDVNQALAVADRFSCLLEGRVSLSGTPGSATRAEITEAYFGLSKTHADMATDTNAPAGERGAS
jgi:branched-chain amino acid transport system ATP-binding protein